MRCPVRFPFALARRGWCPSSAGWLSKRVRATPIAPRALYLPRPAARQPVAMAPAHARKPAERTRPGVPSMGLGRVAASSQRVRLERSESWESRERRGRRPGPDLRHDPGVGRRLGAADLDTRSGSLRFDYPRRTHGRVGNQPDRCNYHSVRGSDRPRRIVRRAEKLRWPVRFGPRRAELRWPASGARERRSTRIH